MVLRSFGHNFRMIARAFYADESGSVEFNGGAPTVLRLGGVRAQSLTLFRNFSRLTPRRDVSVERHCVVR